MKKLIKIRYSKKEDINEVIWLWSEFMKEHHLFFKTGIQPGRKNVETFKKHLMKNIKSKGLIVAEYQKSLIGYILFGRLEHPLEVDFTAGVIHDVYVKKRYRSFGIGRKLMDKVHEIFRRKKYDMAVLRVVYQNSKAIKLYNKLGYCRWTLVMCKKLSQLGL